VACRVATRIEAGVGDLVQRTGPGGRMIERSGDAMCGLHYAQGDKECRFLCSASKPRSIVSPGLASKPMATDLVVWSQNHSVRYPGLGLKISSYSLLIWPPKSP
jgi:hypothetical protein